MRRARCPSRTLSVVALLGVALTPGLRAQSFTRVIGAGDTLPGLGVPLISVAEPPALSGDHVAFVGNFQDAGGGFVTAVFSNAGGSFAPVAMSGQLMPTETVPFQFLFRLAADGDSVAFVGSSFVGGVSREGIYGNHGGTLAEYVDRNDFIPGGFGAFTQIANRPFALDGGRAVFNGSGNNQQRGVYMVNATTHFVQLIADRDTPVPGQAPGTTFNTFGTPRLSGDRVSLQGNFSGGSGIYDQYGAGFASLQLLADTGVALPSGALPNLVAAHAIHENDTVIQAYAPDAGLHPHVDGALATLADGATPIPGGGATFPEFNTLAMSGGRVVFEGYDFVMGGHLGVYTDWCGSLAALVEPGDSVDGQIVQQVSFDTDSLDGDRLVATIHFTSGDHGIYLIDLGPVQHYGAAFASPGNAVPTLSAIGCPAVGASVEFQLRDGPPSGSGFLVAGLSTASVPFFNGGTLLVNPELLRAVALMAPTSSIPGGWRDVLQQLPNDPSLSGVTFFAQAVLRDPLVSGAWLFTDGLQVPIQ